MTARLKSESDREYETFCWFCPSDWLRDNRQPIGRTITNYDISRYAVTFPIALKHSLIYGACMQYSPIQYIHTRPMDTSLLHRWPEKKIHTVIRSRSQRGNRGALRLHRRSSLVETIIYISKHGRMNELFIHPIRWTHRGQEEHVG